MQRKHEIKESIDRSISTLPETNIFAPENGWLEYDRFLLWWPIFRGKLLVSGSAYKYTLENWLWNKNNSWRWLSYQTWWISIAMSIYRKINVHKCTLPKTNSSPLKIGHPKRKFIFQPLIFRCENVSFREGKISRPLGNITRCPIITTTETLQNGSAERRRTPKEPHRQHTQQVHHD